MIDVTWNIDRLPENGGILILADGEANSKQALNYL